MVKFYATTDPEVSEREKKNQTLSRKIAAEGMVLLENNGILPMHLKGKKLLYLGAGQDIRSRRNRFRGSEYQNGQYC